MPDPISGPLSVPPPSPDPAPGSADLRRDHSVETADLLALVAGGELAPSRLAPALAVMRLAPDGSGWRLAWARLLPVLTILFMIAAVICVVAANWQAIGHRLRFAGALVLLSGTVVAAWRVGLDRQPARWLLTLAIGLLGPLLALYGQTYQTGADIHELMFTWAVLALPWMLASRLALAWMLVLAIFEGACFFWLTAIDGWWWLPQPLPMPAWLGAALLQVLALVGWELAAVRLPWLQRPWASRVLVFALLAILTLAAIAALHTDELPWHRLAIACWLAALAAISAGYGGILALRSRRTTDARPGIARAGPDMTMLAMVLLSLTAFLHVLVWRETRSYLLTALVVLAVVAIGAWALRGWQLAADAHDRSRP